MLNGGYHHHLYGLLLVGLAWASSSMFEIETDACVTGSISSSF